MAATETVHANEELELGSSAGASRSWSWHPDIPIKCSPLFERPLRPMAVLRWYARQWLPFTELGCYVILAFVIWQWVQPPLIETTTLQPGWIGKLWLRNLLMMCSIATLLHLWLYTWRGQGDEFRYSRTRPTASKPSFLGGHQLLDNIFWTLASGVTLWTIYETGLWLAYANDIAPLISFSDSPLWFVLWFPLIGIWYSFHFYWVHRLLHWKPLYDRFHSVHHRNVSTGPWSGFSMHPVEHSLYLSSVLIHLVIPSHPVHMLFHLYWLTLATATSHSGYQALLLNKSVEVQIAAFFHQLHHRYFTCNYGNSELPMDRWFGSFNDGSSAATKRLLRRKRAPSQTEPGNQASG